VRGQVNRVPEVLEADYVVMTPTRRVRLATNVEEWDYLAVDPAVKTSAQSTQLTVQLDVHGAQAADNTQLITTMLRSEYACTFLRDLGHGVQPLYADEGMQTPFINGENQYEDRWVIQAQLQATPTVSTPQEFADTLTATLVEIDATYPPGDASP
jgi:hypothetical protein